MYQIKVGEGSALVVLHVPWVLVFKEKGESKIKLELVEELGVKEDKQRRLGKLRHWGFYAGCDHISP